MLAVDGLGEDSRTRGLSHAARAAEEIAVRQTAGSHRVFERGGKRLLPHDGRERRRAVFACRHYVVVVFQYGIVGERTAVRILCHKNSKNSPPRQLSDSLIFAPIPILSFLAFICASSSHGFIVNLQHGESTKGIFNIL